MRRSAAESHRHILSVASDLFYRQGIRATGVDEVAAAANVAATTLYRTFGSKDELVAAYVEGNDAHNREWVEAAIAEAGDIARDQLIAVFDELGRQIRTRDYQGCGCMKAIAEYPDPSSSVHGNAVAAKKWVRERLHSVVKLHSRQTGASLDTAALADELALLFEGTMASASAIGARGPARRATQTAQILIDAAPQVA